MSGLLAGKSILVTGAASGIGFATARLAASEDARVLLADIDQGAESIAAAALIGAGSEALFAPLDVKDERQVEAAVAACVTAYGRIDGAFNNAGIPTGALAPLNLKLAELPEAAWDDMLAVNLTAVWSCMRHEILRTAAQGGGAIVNNASITGLAEMPGHAAYSAAKHGVIGLTRSAAAEYARHGIRINAVCPGFVATPMTKLLFGEGDNKLLQQVPQRRMGWPEEIAEAAVWMLSGRASFLTGTTLTADGGYTAG